MFFRILKRDIKRKKTMNAILLIFMILAATFISASANNLLTVSKAMDNFIEKSNAPDYWFATSLDNDVKKFEQMAKEKGYDYEIFQCVQIEAETVTSDGKKLDFSNSLVLSGLGGTKLFDKNNEELTEIKDGEVYLTLPIYNSEENGFHEGSTIMIDTNGVKREFTVRGYVKDLLYGSEYSGIARILMSKNDFKQFDNEKAFTINSVVVQTDDPDFMDDLNSLNMNFLLSVERSTIKTMYILDMLVAGVLLVVSVCLILISMVILQFIINFTITEEFREIGVMKAIGIKNNKIRGLYIVKYLAISVIGTSVGLIISFPFGKMLTRPISQKIVIAGEDNYLINILSAVLAGIIVIMFSYFCTRKIRRFSPIDAIHNGEADGRYSKKGIIHLSKLKIGTIPFMAFNDILSGIKNYLSMIIIFVLGALLVIIPINTINTLRSDNMIELFNMAKSDHVISKELLFNPNEDNKAKIDKQFNEIREVFSKNNIEADIFQEVLFRANISKGNKRSNSLAFQGVGNVTTDMYVYLEGTAPENNSEVALSYITADKIDAKIGDDVKIKLGEEEETYTVTALLQSMNNLGEGIRFYQDEKLNYNYAAGSFGIQINYKDNPDNKTLNERKALLENLYPDSKIFTSGEYINYQIGDSAGAITSVEYIIIAIVLGINMLVAMLMVKSFITKEKGEIALLKAIGFTNNSLVRWQTLRIGIILLISVLFGALIASPLSSLIITPIFKIMGAYSIEYEIKALEVYVIFPFIVFLATTFAAFLSAQGLRKISSSDISNNE
ncbi:MAG: FtsX-like permease family protein [Roseburia sp.]|nr:FtsX-like permease family protein [Roseburia sp.]MCM1279880.1 FtsX-like permease family protein [Robinsoniella sp.]